MEKKKGNETKIEEIPYQPLPEIVPPGIDPNPGKNSTENQVTEDQLERLRRWEAQNQL